MGTAAAESDTETGWATGGFGCLAAGLGAPRPDEVTDEPPPRGGADERMLLCEVTDEPPPGEVADEPMLLGEVTDELSSDEITHESSPREIIEESPCREVTEESPLGEMTEESATAGRAVGGIMSLESGIGMLVWHFWQRMTLPAALSLTLYRWPHFPHRIGMLIDLSRPHHDLPKETPLLVSSEHSFTSNPN